MSSLNKVFLIGNLTRDPEWKDVGTGGVANFALAINKKWKDDRGALKEKVTFVEIKAWGSQGRVACDFLAKGSSVHIEGELDLESWEKDGEKRSIMKVVCQRLTLLGGRKESGQNGRAGGQNGHANGQGGHGYGTEARRGEVAAGHSDDDLPPDDDVPF